MTPKTHDPAYRMLVIILLTIACVCAALAALRFTQTLDRTSVAAERNQDAAFWCGYTIGSADAVAAFASKPRISVRQKVATSCRNYALPALVRAHLMDATP